MELGKKMDSFARSLINSLKINKKIKNDRAWQFPGYSSEEERRNGHIQKANGQVSGI